MEDDDWRSQLDPASRQNILNEIRQTLKRHVPFSGQGGLQELEKLAVSFEEKIYTVATCQSDYLRKISLKLSALDMKAASNSENPQDPDLIINAQLRDQSQPMPSNNMQLRARAQELAQRRKRRRRNTVTESSSAKVSIDVNSSSEALIPVLSGRSEERPVDVPHYASSAQVVRELDEGDEEQDEASLVRRRRSSAPPPVVPSSSILQDESPEISQNFLLNLPGETDSQLMNQASDGEALAQFSSNLAKMTLWGGNLVARFGGAHDKFVQMQRESKRQVDNMKLMHMELEKSYADMQEKYGNLQADHEKLDAQLLDVVALHSQKLEKAKEEARRDFPNSREGKQLLQGLLESKKEEFKEEFLRSDELRKIIVDQTLVYYYFGYKYLKDQLKAKGIGSSVFKGIKRDDGLTALPEDTSILQQADSDEESEEETNVPLS